MIALLQIIINLLKSRGEITADGLQLRYPYFIIVYPGPKLSRPLSWEGFELDQAVAQLQQWRQEYDTHWIDKDPRIIVESGRWDLVQSV